MGNMTKPKNNIDHALKLAQSQLAEVTNSARRALKVLDRTGVTNEAELNVMAKIPAYLLELLDEKQELNERIANLKYQRMLRKM
jgi:hypothetical protein